MDNDFSLLPQGSFPVYTLSNERARACQSYCALIWPPVLTSGRPEAGPGVDQHALGVVVRPDGTRQVTYQGEPLYLFIKDAYIPGIIGTQSINGAGAVTPWGVFNTIPLT
jgi:predicted lipoprotein with Yx(FWY)xxD motif